MAHFELFLFGQPRLRCDGRAFEIGLRKALGLLAYLAVTKQVHSRETLAALFWPESDQTSARASLRRTLYTLNQALGDGIITADLETIALDPQADLWLDVDEFSGPARECTALGEVTQEVGADCLSRLTAAAQLYSADFLAGFTLPDSAAFDEWQFFEAEGLRQLFSQVLVQLVRAHQERAEFRLAIEYGRRWLALDPLNEPAHRQLMQLYALTGQKATALRQYQQCERILRDDLGLAPQPETRQLYERIRLGRKPDLPMILSPGPTTRYVANDKVHIAYQVLGSGPRDVIFAGGYVSHLEQIWEEPDLARFFQQLATFTRLILFDKRGMGLSDRVGYPPSLENTVADMLAVMNAVGSTNTVAFGASEGGTSSALLAATYPERVVGLILYGTAAKGIKSADYPWALTREQYDRWLAQLMINWGAALSLESFAPSRAQDERLQGWWAKLLRLASSPGEIKAVLEAMRDMDIRSALPAVRVPTLVLHRTDDRAIRVGNARFIASQIPRAQYVELPGDDHWWWIGDTQRILTEIKTFLQQEAFQ
jgi:DNA-binding SARP family transcriptional activator/pimeloyl-ACP methyl ester carboxylesterase